MHFLNKKNWGRYLSKSIPALFAFALLNFCTCKPTLSGPLYASLVATLGPGNQLQKYTLSPWADRLLTVSSTNEADLWDVPSGKKVLVLAGSPSSIQSTHFSADEKYLVTSYADGTAIVWNAHSGQKIQTIVSDSVRSDDHQLASFADAIISPDGKMLATVVIQEHSFYISTWEVASAQRIRTFATVPGDYNALDFSPDGAKLLSTSSDPGQSVLIWDVATSSVVQDFSEVSHTMGAWLGLFSPDGTKVLVARYDAKGFPAAYVEIWDTKTSKFLFNLSNGSEWVTAAAFSPDSSQIVLGGNHGNVVLFNAIYGDVVAFLGDHQDTVHTARFTQDGDEVISMDDDRRSITWDAKQRKPDKVLSGQLDLIRTATFSPDNVWIGTAGNDQTAILWDATSGNPVHVLRHTDVVHFIDFSTDNTSAVTASEDQTAVIWDVKTGAKKLTLPHKSPLRFASFSANNTSVVTVDNFGEINFWDSGSGKNIYSKSLDIFAPLTVAISSDRRYLVIVGDNQPVQIWDILAGNWFSYISSSEPVLSASFSEDGKQLLMSTTNGKILFMDLASQTIRRMVWESTDQNLYSVVLSKDGRWVAARTADRAIVWEVRTGEIVCSFLRPPGITSVAFSSQGSQLLIGGAYTATVVEDIVPRQKQARFIEGFSGDHVTSATFSPSAKEVLTTHLNGSVELWDLQTRSIITPYVGHKDKVSTASFAPDGQFFVTGGDDGKLIWWNISVGTPIRIMNAPDKILSAQFSRDGRYVLTADKSANVILWDISDGSIVRFYKDSSMSVLSPDGKTVALQHGVPAFIDLQDIASNTTLQSLESPGRNFISAAFSPDGNQITMVDAESTITVWDPKTGDLLRTFKNSEDLSLTDAIVSPDGKSILAIAALSLFTKPSGAFLLDIDTGTKLWRLDQILDDAGYSSGFSSMQFSPDGTSIVTGSWDGTARIFSVPKPIFSLSGGGF